VSDVVRDELLTEQDVAARYYVSVHTVRRWRRQGLLGYLKIGRLPLYRASDLEAFERHAEVAPVVMERPVRP